MDRNFSTEQNKLYGISYRILFAVIFICVLPSIFNFSGLDFGIQMNPLDLDKMESSTANDQKNMLYAIFRGRFIHIFLVSISIATAFLTALLTFVDFRLSRDISTPIVGIALICACVFDIFHVLTISRFISLPPQILDITPFTWLFTRTFHAIILITGVLTYLLLRTRNKIIERKDERAIIFIIAGIFILLTVLTINIILSTKRIPVMVYPSSLISKPFDLIPLFLYLISGFILFPRFYKANPTRFSQMLIISLIPAIFSQLHMSFGSRDLFDNHFFIAHWLEGFSYFIPFVGISLNYVDKYKSEKLTSEKLNDEIEQRRDAQLRVLRSELNLKEAQEIGQMGSFDWDMKSNTVTWSDELYRIHEYRPNEIQVNLETFFNHVAEFDKDRVAQILDNTVKNAEELNYSFALITKNKKLKYAHAMGKVILSEEGIPERLIGTLVDITELMETQKKLVKSEASLLEAQGIAGMATWSMLLRDQSIEFSDLLKEISGRSNYEFVRFQDYLNILHPDDAKSYQKIIDESIKERLPFKTEYRIITDENQIKWMFSNSKVIIDILGQPQMISIVLDITSRKVSELALIESSVRFQSIFDQTFQMVGLLDLDGKLIEVNKKAVEISGLPNSDKMLGTYFGDSFAWNIGNARKLVKEGVEKAKIGKTSNFETIITDWKNNHIEIAVIIKPIFNTNSEIVNILAEGRDVSQLKKYEKELELRINDLNKSNKELEQFAYVASHDLQEPLRKIQSFSERLYAKYSSKLDGDGKDYMDRMQNAASRMQILINDLLSFSRVSNIAINFLPVDLNETLALLINDFEIQIDKKDAIITIKELPVIYGNEGQIRQLFQNLLSNSLKFSRAGIRPCIEIWSETLKKNQNSSSSNENNVYNIYFKDNGIGFDQKYNDKIFIIFQRLHGRGEFEGTGIGLSICKKIVENHGGKILANSEIGSGTTFRMTFNKFIPALDEEKINQGQFSTKS